MNVQFKFKILIALIILFNSAAAYAEVDRIEGVSTIQIPASYYWSEMSEFSKICISPLSNLNDVRCTDDSPKHGDHLTVLFYDNDRYVFIDYGMQLGTPEYEHRGAPHALWYGDPMGSACNAPHIKNFVYPNTGGTVNHVENIDQLPSVCG